VPVRTVSDCRKERRLQSSDIHREPFEQEEEEEEESEINNSFVAERKEKKKEETLKTLFDLCCSHFDFRL